MAVLAAQNWYRFVAISLLYLLAYVALDVVRYARSSELRRPHCRTECKSDRLPGSCVRFNYAF
jgi:hypothetical protein